MSAAAEKIIITIGGAIPPALSVSVLPKTWENYPPSLYEPSIGDCLSVRPSQGAQYVRTAR